MCSAPARFHSARVLSVSRSDEIPSICLGQFLRGPHGKCRSGIGARAAGRLFFPLCCRPLPRNHLRSSCRKCGWRWCDATYRVDPPGRGRNRAAAPSPATPEGCLWSRCLGGGAGSALEAEVSRGTFCGQDTSCFLVTIGSVRGAGVDRGAGQLRPLPLLLSFCPSLPASPEPWRGARAWEREGPPQPSPGARGCSQGEGPSAQARSRAPSPTDAPAAGTTGAARARWGPGGRRAEDRREASGPDGRLTRRPGSSDGAL